MTIITQPKTLQEFKKALDNAGVPRAEVRDNFGDLRTILAWEKAYQHYVDSSYEIFDEENDEEEFVEVLDKSGDRDSQAQPKKPSYSARPYISEFIQVFKPEEIVEIRDRYERLLPEPTAIIPIRENEELFLPLILAPEKEQDEWEPINRIFKCLVKVPEIIPRCWVLLMMNFPGLPFLEVDNNGEIRGFGLFKNFQVRTVFSPDTS